MRVMRSCSHDSAFEWIRNGRDKLNPIGRDDPGWKGNFVSRLIPKAFEAYIKILHRIDANREDPCSQLSEGEIAILRIPPCRRLRALVERTRETSQGSRIRWARIAELLEVPVKPEICLQWFATKLEAGCWPRFLRGPADGSLEGEEIAELVSILLPLTRTDHECFFRFPEVPFIGTEKPIQFQGALSEVGAFLGPYQFTFEYWWPADRQWCVCSDYDLAFTIVGGSKDLISRLLTNEALETLEVTPQTRIDSFAPIP